MSGCGHRFHEFLVGPCPDAPTPPPTEDESAVAVAFLTDIAATTTPAVVGLQDAIRDAILGCSGHLDPTYATGIAGVAAAVAADWYETAAEAAAARVRALLPHPLRRNAWVYAADIRAALDPPGPTP